ncbi:MAG: hypothetical protein GY822_08560 [Deltaproteobacteria bacterium]|nr:hypothetical protein [Deltaproteobacteria bacterium]
MHFLAGPTRTLTFSSASSVLEDAFVDAGASLILTSNAAFNDFFVYGRLVVEPNNLVDVQDDLTLGSGAEIDNRCTLTVAGNFENLGGTLTGNPPN